MHQVILVCFYSHRVHRGRSDDTRERAAAAPIVLIPVSFRY